MNPMWILSLLFLLLLITVFYFNYKEFTNYLKLNLLSITVNLFLVLFGAFFAIYGVQWAFEKETERILDFEINSFKHSFHAVMMENSKTLSLIKRLKSEEISDTYFSNRFSTSVSESARNNPLLYAYSGNEYIVALGTYVNLALRNNSLLDHYDNKYTSTGSLSAADISEIKESLDRLQYYTTILQHLCELYKCAYGDAEIPRYYRDNEILNWLTNYNNESLNKIEHEIKLFNDNREKKCNTLCKGMQKTLEKLRESNIDQDCK